MHRIIGVPFEDVSCFLFVPVAEDEEFEGVGIDVGEEGFYCPGIPVWYTAGRTTDHRDRLQSGS
jgi:hypothetical protein